VGWITKLWHRGISDNEERAMPLERHIDDLTACDGIKFWMSDGECPVLCRVSHEALRDLAERVISRALTKRSSRRIGPGGAVTVGQIV